MPVRYTPEALESASGVPHRSIKEWIRKKVLPPPIGVGRGAHYNEAHLTAARVIRQMRAADVPLDVIRQRIRGRTLEELRALLVEMVAADEVATAAEAALESDAGFFERVQTLQAVELMKGLTLMVEVERGEARRVAEEIWRRYGGR